MSGKMRKVASMLLALILALGLSVGSFAEVLLIDQKQANAPEEGIELDSSDPEAVVSELDINLPVEVDGLSGMVDAEAIAGQDEEMKQSDVVENASAIPDAVTLGVGEKFTIKYVKGRKYRTSDKKVATVSSKGVITAKKKGRANITVKKGKKVLGICTVYVKKAPSKLTLNKKKATIQEIDTLQLVAKLPKGTFTSKLTWTSSNKSVATVNSEGLVTAKKPGSATITVKTANGKKASCKLTVKKGKRTELQKYLGGDFYAATDKLGLEYDREYSYDIGDATINCVTYSRYDNEGGFLSFDSEDGKHTDFINCASRRYMICGIYVGMTKAQAKKQAKTKKWEYEGEADPDGNGVLYIFYHNSKGHNLTVCVENKKVSHVMLNWNEQFAVTHYNWMDDYASGDFIKENHEMKPTMEKGDSDFFYINSNIDWTVEKTDVVGKGWLGLSADSGEAGETQLELTVNKLPKVGKTYSSTLVFTTASGRKYSGTVSLTREEEQPKVELSDYMWGDFYSAVEALGLSINTDSDDYTWAKDENHTISIGAFDSNHICDIWTNNSQYTLFGLYAGMTESDALGIIESDGWVMTGSDDDGWSCYVNSQGDDLYLYINDNAVQCVQAHREEQFRVTRAGDDFINNYTALEQNAGVGFTEVLNVESNVRWTVKQIDETVSGWLGISPQKGGEGETTLTLTVKKAPAQESTYYSTLVFTTEGGNEYSGVVHIGNDVEPVVDPTGITLNKTELSLKINDTMSLEATVTPSDANNKTVTWNSSDPYVASVDNNGMITALSAGSTTITAMTCNGIEATCQVTVDEIYPSKVTLDQTSLSLEVDKQVTLVATISPANATATSVTWSSSKASVATVDSSGMVTARAAGTATITVETQNGKTATCTVTVVPQTIDISSVTMSEIALSMMVGDTETLAANPFPLDAAVSSGATWSSSNTAVATVNSKGKVTAKGEGTAIITATIVSDLGTSRTGKCTVTVVPKSIVRKGQFNTSSIKVKAGSKTTVSISGAVQNSTLDAVTVNGQNTTDGNETGNIYYNNNWDGESSFSDISVMIDATSTGAFSVPGEYLLKLWVRDVDTEALGDNGYVDTLIVTVQSNYPSGQFITFESYFSDGVTWTGSPFIAMDDTKPTSKVKEGEIYDQSTKYYLAAGDAIDIPFSTDMSAAVVTAKLRYNNNGIWYTYTRVDNSEVAATTRSFTKQDGAKRGFLTITLPEDIPSGVYMFEMWSKNSEGDYISARVKVSIKGTRAQVKGYKLSASDVSELVEKNFIGAWNQTGRFRGVLQGAYGGALISSSTYSNYFWGSIDGSKMCNRGATSMALSYMGIDLKPVDFANGSYDTEGVEGVSIVYKKGIKHRKITRSPTWNTFKEYYDRYVNDARKGDVSPVILYTDYKGDAHWLTVIGQDNIDSDYFWVLDPANGKHSQIKFTEIAGSLRIEDYRYKNNETGRWEYSGYPADRYSANYAMYKLIQFVK